MAKRYWLYKSEPDVFSIEDLKSAKKTTWDGVRNYQARNFLKEASKGDAVLFYHSRSNEVVGSAEVVKGAYPDPTQFDRASNYFDAKATDDEPRWFVVDIRFGEIFPRPVSLDEIKGLSACRDMVLLKRGRLSVQPVTPPEWEAVRALGREG